MNTATTSSSPLRLTFLSRVSFENGMVARGDFGDGWGDEAAGVSLYESDSSLVFAEGSLRQDPGWARGFGADQDSLN
jgi:hypothetical protein